MSPAYVEYDRLENGGPRIHAERGVVVDVGLDTAHPFTLYWFLETQATTGNDQPDPNMVPVVTPNVMVRATMRAGDEISVGDEAYDSGAVIAQGQVGPAHLAADGTSQANPAGSSVTYHKLPNGRHLYEFAIPMDMAPAARVTREDGANVRIDAWMENPVCNDPEAGYFMANTVRVHTSAEHRPRMEAAFWNVMRVAPPTMQALPKGTQLFEVEAVSAFGNYDVAAVSLAVAGPAGVELKAIHVVEPFVHENGEPKPPVERIWLWEGATPGTYNVTATASNLQGTATESSSTELVIQEDRDAAGVGAALVACGLAILARLGRRRE